jgi:hypothetical protein
MLKTNEISQDLAQAFTKLPADSAGLRVSLCRAEA